jgi:CheY-like chemotaxis protein
MPQLLAAPPQGAILPVDDAEALAALGHIRLTRLGYDVVVVSSSAAALALFRAAPQRFALLITDYLMPGLTGLELAVACQQLWPELPVILCTGSSAKLADLPAPPRCASMPSSRNPLVRRRWPTPSHRSCPSGSCGRPK